MEYSGRNGVGIVSNNRKSVREVFCMTIKDLAAKTGYGVATVSRVLNHHPNVSEKARQAILAAVEESGFQINANARQLKQQQSTSILVVVKGTSNELFAELLEAIQALAAQTQYPVAVDYLDENANEVLRARELVREKKPLGILFLGGNREHFLSDFDKIDLPCVLITNDATGLPFEKLSSVCTDDRAGAKCAMDRLVALGHRKIAVVGGDPAVSDTAKLRYAGYLQSLEEQGIAFDPEQDYCSVRFSCQGGYDGVRALLDRGRTFTGLLTGADVMAIGAIRALHEAGLRVPEDVSVVGYDGLPLGSFLVPQLTTVVQPVALLAKRSMEILTDCIENGAKSCHERVSFSLLERESTKML